MVLTLLSLACIKPTPPEAAEVARTVDVIGVIDAAGAAPATDTPERFDASITHELGRRNLTPRLVEAPEVFAGFSEHRDTRERFAAGGAEPLLLVETAPVFYSELNGQYRWTVGVKVAVVTDGQAVQSVSFDVPVFLRFHHEREADAVDAAAPVVARRVGEVLDTWLRSTR